MTLAVFAGATEDEKRTTGGPPLLSSPIVVSAEELPKTLFNSQTAGTKPSESPLEVT